MYPAPLLPLAASESFTQALRDKFRDFSPHAMSRRIFVCQSRRVGLSDLHCRDFRSITHPPLSAYLALFTDRVRDMRRYRSLAKANDGGVTKYGDCGAHITYRHPFSKA